MGYSAEEHNLRPMSRAHRYQAWIYEQFRPHLRVPECTANIR